MKTFKLVAVVALSVLFLASCAETPKWQKGAGIGAAIGAGAGAIIGHQSDEEGEGALIGAAIGAAAGGLIGHHMDKQQAELAEIAEVERRSEDELVVILREKILFDVDKYDLKPGAEDNLYKIADILMRYPDFDIVAEGHTDSTGKENYNQWLSEERAAAVTDFLVNAGLNPARIRIIGYGETRPVANNETDAGRQQNRRVELHIKARQA